MHTESIIGMTLTRKHEQNMLAWLHPLYFPILVQMSCNIFAALRESYPLNAFNTIDLAGGFHSDDFGHYLPKDIYSLVRNNRVKNSRLQVEDSGF